MTEPILALCSTLCFTRRYEAHRESVKDITFLVIGPLVGHVVME
jgi:hypothetical protein